MLYLLQGIRMFIALIEIVKSYKPKYCCYCKYAGALLCLCFWRCCSPSLLVVGRVFVYLRQEPAIRH